MCVCVCVVDQERRETEGGGGGRDKGGYFGRLMYSLSARHFISTNKPGSTEEVDIDA